MKKIPVLVVEDELLVNISIKGILNDAGFDAETVQSGSEAKKALKEKSFKVIILDIGLPDTSGETLLEQWRKKYPDTEIIILTANAECELAFECCRKGAHKFLAKPIDKEPLIEAVKNAAKTLKLQKEVRVLKKIINHRPETIDIVGQSEALTKTLETAGRVAESDPSCLLIQGESGTGKGLFAHTVHQMGSRADKPFVDINCSALPATLIESELFGHRKGAFTDAKEEKIGLFELADGGTLFLDEIGDMEIALQAKLLKVIEEQRFRRLGGTDDISVDVAIIAATNQKLETLIKRKKFRLDLYYRLNVIEIALPPLRDRIDDLPLLADHFVDVFVRKLGRKIKGFTPDAMKALQAHSWPGNVREFRNVVERGCILTKDETIGDLELMFPRIPGVDDLNLADSIESLPAMPLATAEEMVIRAAFREAGGNENKAARILGVHRTKLHKKIEEYDIDFDD